MRYNCTYRDGGVLHGPTARHLIRGNRFKARNYMRRFVPKPVDTDETRIEDRTEKIRLSVTYPSVTVLGGAPTPPPAPPEPVISEPENPDDDIT